MLKKLFKKKNQTDKDTINISEEDIAESKKEPDKNLQREKPEKIPTENHPEKEKVDIEKNPEESKQNKGLFRNLKDKLVKSKEGLFGDIKNLFVGKKIIDDEMYDELEDILVQSDIGLKMTEKIVGNLETEVKKRKIKTPIEVYEILEEVLESFLIEENNELLIENKKLNVILIVGVNGVGKTTTIGKLAQQFKQEGKRVIIGAADTFRAAAIEQLEEWANRSETEIVKHAQGSDPGAVVFDTLKAAKTRRADIAIIDTAGRLHNKSNLMKELAKINKIIKKEIGEDTFYESILVIDGTTGQNGLNQAKIFSEVTDLSGFIITKLDGTAKGGIIFSVSEELQKPVKYIGVGEGMDDLRKFNPKEFIKAIFED